ncbi:MAG TPA: universal stress protein [Nitrospiria bacterium]|jgi:nucleotide-binding universal stress UspA family protein
MAKFKKILVPVDFTEYSDEAISYAELLAITFQAKILLFHVIEQFTYSVSDTIQVMDHYTTLKEISEQMLENKKKQLKRKGIVVESMVLKGNPALEIVKYSETKRVNLIVIGSHGRTGIQHLVLGSVAERVVRMSSCPVLTIKRKKKSEGKGRKPKR